VVLHRPVCGPNANNTPQLYRPVCGPNTNNTPQLHRPVCGPNVNNTPQNHFLSMKEYAQEVKASPLCLGYTTSYVSPGCF